MSGLFANFDNLARSIGYIYGNLPVVIQGFIVSFFGITILFGIAKMIKD